MDNWVGGKPAPSQAQDEGGDDAAAQTPATGRSKKTATLTGTGAGVKKRGAATPGGTPRDAVSGRTRMAKSRAILEIQKSANMLQRMMEGEDDDIDDELEEMDVEMDDVPESPEAPESPTRKKGPVACSSQEDPGHNEPTALITDEFADFPAVMPDLVIQRQAILVDLEGVWTVSLAPDEVHAQWLSRLPADIQSRFYSQSNAARNRARAKADADDESAKNTNSSNRINATGPNVNTGTYLANAIGNYAGPIIYTGTYLDNVTGNNVFNDNADDYIIVRSDDDHNSINRQLFGEAFKSGAAHTRLVINANPAMPPSTPPNAGRGMPMTMPPRAFPTPSRPYGSIFPGTGRTGTGIGGSMGATTSMGTYVANGFDPPGAMNPHPTPTSTTGAIPSTAPGPTPGYMTPHPRPTPTGNIDTNRNMASSAVPNATIPSAVPATTPGAIPPRPAPTDPETLTRMAREQEVRDLMMLFGDAYDEEGDF